MQRRHYALVLSALFALSACGGGGRTSPPSALPPVANPNGSNAGNTQQSSVAPKFTVVDLGAAVFPNAVNLNGEVVGSDGTTQSKAFSYSNGAMHVYGTLPGGTTSAARDVNDSGEIVGYSDGGTPSATHAVVFTASSVVDLGGLSGSTYNIANGINNLGEIVGTSLTNAGAGCGSTEYYSAVEFDGHGGATALFGLGDGYAVNDAGVAVGDDCADGENFFPWATTGPVAFPPNCFQGAVHFQDSANDINDAGDVIGEYAAVQTSQNPPYCNYHGFLTKGALSSDIPGPGGKTADGTYVNGVNINDWVVGKDVTLGHAILYINGTVYDLNSLLTGTGCSLWTLQNATDINNANVIVGTGLVGGTEHGFMLVPEH